MIMKVNMIIVIILSVDHLAGDGKLTRHAGVELLQRDPHGLDLGIYYVMS